MIVGNTQRVTRYVEHGFDVAQGVPDDVHDAYRHLVDAGYAKRHITA